MCANEVKKCPLPSVCNSNQRKCGVEKGKKEKEDAPPSSDHSSLAYIARARAHAHTIRHLRRRRRRLRDITIYLIPPHGPPPIAPSSSTPARPPGIAAAARRAGGRPGYCGG